MSLPVFEFTFTTTCTRNSQPFVALVTWHATKKAFDRTFFPITITPTGRFEETCDQTTSGSFEKNRTQVSHGLRPAASIRSNRLPIGHEDLTILDCHKRLWILREIFRPMLVPELVLPIQERMCF